MVEVSIRDCPVCKGSRNTVFMKESAYNNRDHIQLLKCDDCGFVFSKSVCIDYSSFGKSASMQSKEELEKIAISQGIPELVAEIMNKTSVKAGKVLDFGCGVGLTIRGFKNKSYDVIGVEGSEAFRNMLEKDGIPAVASLSDVEEIQKPFDIVIMKDVVEHLEHPLETLDEIVSFIKPGGFLYVRVPNRYAYPFHWAVDTKGHINHFTPGVLRKALKNSGLKFHDYVRVYDISSRAGKLYDYVFWKLRYLLPMTHQISLLYKKN